MSKSKGLGLVVLLSLLVAPMLHAQTPLTPKAYVPLSTGEKASVFGHRMIAPSAFAKTAFTAGIDQAKNAPFPRRAPLRGTCKPATDYLVVRIGLAAGLAS